MRSTMACRTAGKVGGGGGPLILFFPPRLFETTILKEGEGDHRHERVPVEALPGSSLEVVETELLLQLLVGLLADPSCLDRRRQAAQICPGRQVGKIVFLLPGHAVLADEPGLVPWKMLLPLIPYPLGRSVGAAHTDSSKSGFQPAFRPAAPTHSSPLSTGQHV